MGGCRSSFFVFSKSWATVLCIYLNLKDPFCVADDNRWVRQQNWKFDKIILGPKLFLVTSLIWGTRFPEMKHSELIYTLAANFWKRAICVNNVSTRLCARTLIWACLMCVKLEKVKGREITLGRAEERLAKFEFLIAVNWNLWRFTTQRQA